MSDDFVAKKAELKELQRRLRDRERKQADREVVAEEGLGSAATFVTETRNIGILPPAASPTMRTSAIDQLRSALQTPAEEQIIWYAEGVAQTELNRLNDERVALRSTLRKHRDGLEAVNSLISVERGAARESDDQMPRLSSRELFSLSDGTRCQLCKQSTPEYLPSQEHLRQEIQRAIDRLDRVVRHTPGFKRWHQMRRRTPSGDSSLAARESR